jgi:hypothetical protein
MTTLWLIVGGSVFGFVGLLHAFYTLADMSHPRRLVPDDAAVMQAMATTGLRLARGGTTMWRTWVGFNFSHSLGLVIFGSGCIAVGLSLRTLALPKAALLVPVAIGAIYVLLAVLYWFRGAVIAVAAGALGLIIAWWIY